jgi:hypothetical protein
VHPSDRTNEPEPVRPENRPVLVQLKPWTDPPLRVAPFGLTEPELNSPEILPPEITNRSVALPHGVPVATETHEPSKLPPPLPPSPPLFREARRGSSASGLARRAGLADSTARGASREPDNDFSSLPMLPPALPDWATAPPPAATATRSGRRPIPIKCLAGYLIMKCSNISRPWRAAVLLLRRRP